MPYATPTQYLQRYGRTEAVGLLRDEERLLTEQLLADAIAGTWTGTPSQAEQDAGTAALARLQRELGTMSNFIDGYLRARVVLPLAGDDANVSTLADCCMALVREALSDDHDNLTEQVTDTANRWRAWLRDVANGRVQLVTDAGAAPAARPGVRSGQAASSYDWAGFGAGLGGGR